MVEKEMEKKMSNKPSFSYYSNVLNKPFDTLKALQEAEAAESAKREAEERKTEQKKADARKVEVAYQHLIDVKAESCKAIKEAEEAYVKAKQAFIDKYGSYHFTYSSRDGNVTLGVSDIVDTIFSNFFDIFN